MRPTLRVAAFWFASVLLVTSAVRTVRGENNGSVDRPDTLQIKEAQTGLPMEEVASTPDSEALGWQSLYSAYVCVGHHSYAIASRWFLYALRQGAGAQLLKARTDLAYLSKGLSSVAAQRHEAIVPDTSCDAQVLQALMEDLVGNKADSVDILKTVVLNNSTYPSLQYLKTKIRAMEFEMSGDPRLFPADVMQIGGNNFSRWNLSKFPLKVYIPTDATASKVEGYSAGDGQLVRSALEAWQKQSSGKVRFVYEPVQVRADITCTWVSDQKDLQAADAIGICSRSAGASNYLGHADIKVLTFTTSRYSPSGFDNQFRKSCLQEVFLHELGHSLGLNHSTGENDVMCPHAHWQPITTPTTRDVASLNSLYVTSDHDFINAGLHALEVGQYKVALAAFDKAIMENPKDSQTRDTICVCLNNAASHAIDQSDYTAAISLLTKANELASASATSQTRQRVLKNLHYAYLQSGRLEEAQALEKQDASLRSDVHDSASFLDQYGINRDSLPHYEEAFATNPNDLAIRKKYCFLLVMLARDESNKNNDDEAMALLARAKSLLRIGMPSQIIGKVMSALSQEYLKEERYDEADQTRKEAAALITLATAVNKDTSADDIAFLVAAAKMKHPKDWSGRTDEKLGCAKLRLAYEQYVEVLRKCASTMNAKEEPGWAAGFIVRHKRHDGDSAHDQLGKVFDLRDRIIALTDERTVINLECRLPFKAFVPKPLPSSKAKPL